MQGQMTLSRSFVAGDFPSGPLVKNPPSNAGGGVSISGRRTRNQDAARAPQLESPSSATTEPMHSRACAPQLSPSTAKIN